MNSINVSACTREGFFSFFFFLYNNGERRYSRISSSIPIGLRLSKGANHAKAGETLRGIENFYRCGYYLVVPIVSGQVIHTRINQKSQKNYTENPISRISL
jgi:hypothetical protein